MSDDKPAPIGRARGRAKGRARSQQQQGVAAEAPQLAAPGPSGGGRSHGRGAAVERPGGLQQQQQQVEQVTQQMEALHGPSGGRGGKNGNGSGNNGTGNSGNNGNGANGKPVGRGVMRGTRELTQILCTRPDVLATKCGQVGSPVTLFVNYFKLNKTQNWLLSLYHVDFTPEQDRTFMKKKLLRQHAAKLSEGYIFDGQALFMNKLLAKKTTEFTSKDEVTGTVFKLSVTLIKELHPLDNQFIQILNLLLRHCQDHLGLKLLGRNYYNAAAETEVKAHNIKIWPGYLTSIRQFEDDIMLNIDVTHKFMREETVYRALVEAKKTNRKWEYLLGSVVMTTYNNKTYKLDDMNFKTSPVTKFPFKGGEKSYVDYYKEKYNIAIRDIKQPMIVSRPSKQDIRRGMTSDIYLVPELCILTGLTEDMRSDYGMMKDLAGYMRMTPDKRIETLKTFNRSFLTNEKIKAEMKQWGLSMESQLVSVPGRLLPEEKITQGVQTVSYQRHKSDWSNETRNAHLNTPIPISNWAVVFPDRNREAAQDFLNTIPRIAQNMGITLQRPQMMPIKTDQVNDYIQQLKNCGGMQIVVIILSNQRGDRYGAIKKLMSCTLAVPTQCILSKTLMKKQRLMNVVTKVVIQMNCKLGGDIWSVAVPMKKAMIIGYDTYHDSASKGASYGAVVSSLNQNWTQYYGQVAKHLNKEELTDNFSACVKRSLEAYIKRNQEPPTTILVFRDGVGEGQIGYVKEHEIAAIKSCLKRVLNTEVKFAFIVVSKRINTRIFQSDQRSNPLPGTVVDSVITLPERYDFYLISQSVGQGTVTPTSFNVIADNSFLKPDHMQRIAYKLTHLYYNWQGTVRVPAPCLYAHKLAYITGTAIHDTPHQSMADKLWYL